MDYDRERVRNRLRNSASFKASIIKADKLKKIWEDLGILGDDDAIDKWYEDKEPNH